MSFFSFSPSIIYSSDELPVTLISLEDWLLVVVTGEDSQQYLQGQLTADVKAVNKKKYVFSAHCNFNGKVWSVVCLFFYKGFYAYIERRSVADIQIEELKKYSVFSKVHIIKEKNTCLLGVAGLNARLSLSKFFIHLPNHKIPIITKEKYTILWFNQPKERFLLVLSLKDAYILKNNLNKEFSYNNSQQWLALDIEAGFPVIDKELSSNFLPQAINLDKFKAVSLNKGCYYGQEMISKVHFKNLNKRTLLYLISKNIINCKIGTKIEIFMKKTWHKIGYLLSFVHIKYIETWIQVVLDKPVHKHCLFRIYGCKDIFFIKN